MVIECKEIKSENSPETPKPKYVNGWLNVLMTVKIKRTTWIGRMNNNARCPWNDRLQETSF